LKKIKLVFKGNQQTHLPTCRDPNRPASHRHCRCCRCRYRPCLCHPLQSPPLGYCIPELFLSPSGFVISPSVPSLSLPPILFTSLRGVCAILVFFNPTPSPQKVRVCQFFLLSALIETLETEFFFYVLLSKNHR